MANGRITFSEENVVKKSGGDYDFPKFKLETKDQIGRILLRENPVAAYVHNIQHPIIEEGLPVMTTKTTKTGTEYKVHKMGFISRPICLGDEGILAEKGLDPKNCPACKFAEDNPDRAQAPQRRFAMHVVQYNTKKDGSAITPFGVQVKVWAFTERYFNKIVELSKEWGDLTKRDLVVVCENPDFQGYDIKIGADSWALTDEKRGNLVDETFVEDNMTPDLTIFCGRASEERFVKADIAKASSFWGIVDRVNGTAASGAAGTLEGALDTLLSRDEKPAISAGPVDAEGWAVVEDKTETGEPTFTAKPAGSPASNFDDILADLK